MSSALEAYLQKGSKPSVSSKYDFSEISELKEKSKPTPLRHTQANKYDPPMRRRDMQSNHKSSERKAPSENKSKTVKSKPQKETKVEEKPKEARLTDLCAEDKSKIGELVKKLASESRQRQQSESRYEDEKQAMERRLKELELKTQEYENQREGMTEKLQNSIGMLRTLKEAHTSVERQKIDSERKLVDVRNELLESKLTQEALMNDQNEEQQSYREQVSRLRADSENRERELLNQISSISEQASLQQQESQRASESSIQEGTIREIGELKSEIARLTSSLGHFSSFQNQHIQSQQSDIKAPSPQKQSNNFTEEKQVKQEDHMDLDELQSMQDSLLKRLEATNNLISERSAAKTKGSTSSRGINNGLSAQERAHMQAQAELNRFQEEEEVSSEDDLKERQLDVIPQKQEVLSEKMKAVKEIQSRFQQQQEVVQHKENVQIANNRGFKEDRQVQQNQEEYDEAEDLAVLLNSENKQQDFNESLFTIIDEMEEEESKQSTPAREANQFFKTDDLQAQTVNERSQIGMHLQKEQFNGTGTFPGAQNEIKPNFTMPARQSVPLLNLATKEQKQALNHGSFENFKDIMNRDLSDVAQTQKTEQSVLTSSRSGNSAYKQNPYYLRAREELLRQQRQQ